jgi:invasion protein IalB
MIILLWIFAGMFAVSAGLLLSILAQSAAAARRENLPDVETQPHEQRGAWSRMMCRNRRTNRLSRWVRVNKVLR